MGRMNFRCNANVGRAVGQVRNRSRSASRRRGALIPPQFERLVVRVSRDPVVIGWEDPPSPIAPISPSPSLGQGSDGNGSSAALLSSGDGAVASEPPPSPHSPSLATTSATPASLQEPPIRMSALAFLAMPRECSLRDRGVALPLNEHGVTHRNPDGLPFRLDVHHQRDGLVTVEAPPRSWQLILNDCAASRWLYHQIINFGGMTDFGATVDRMMMEMESTA